MIALRVKKLELKRNFGYFIDERKVTFYFCYFLKQMEFYLKSNKVF